jgi:CHAT domain-containing protein
MVARMLGTEPLIGPQATKAKVLEHLSNAENIHLATHAQFTAGSPLNSSIVVADGLLTAREVMSERLRAELLILSACETGMTQTLGGMSWLGWPRPSCMLGHVPFSPAYGQ